ncbi:MAG: hypothetical protein Ta2B_13300 [Termitinemataceae bacterium]|nr:MAG: hypothetical protein Ta2B_13300 [Termitinemataceae bacterium]
MCSSVIPPHINWLIDKGERSHTADGKEILILEFQHKKDNSILSAWATHFRNHYCLDSEIDLLIGGTDKTKRQYLIDTKFPDETIKPGPSIRSGDFAEILVSDYIEYLLNYDVPRTRYIAKTIRNESTKGSDVIGFKIISPMKPSLNDEMIIFEVKATLSNKGAKNRLQNAVNDSKKDEVRQGESLNAIKNRYITAHQLDSAKKIARFQDKVGNPYIEKSGAAAVLEKIVFNNSDFSTTDISGHYNKENLFLIIITGEQMMNLVHALYRRAADEA